MALDREDFRRIARLVLGSGQSLRGHLMHDFLASDGAIYEVISQGNDGFMVVKKRAKGKGLSTAPYELPSLDDLLSRCFDKSIKRRRNRDIKETNSEPAQREDRSVYDGVDFSSTQKAEPIRGTVWANKLSIEGAFQLSCDGCGTPLFASVSPGHRKTLLRVSSCCGCGERVFVGVDPASDGPDYSGSSFVGVRNEDGSWTDIVGNISDVKLNLWEGGKRVETTNKPSRGSRVDTEYVRSAAKVYRTEILEKEVECGLEVMLTAIAGEDKEIRVEENAVACQEMATARGIKHGPERSHKWVAECTTQDETGEIDVQVKTGETRAGALAALLSCLLDGPFYPRT